VFLLSFSALLFSLQQLQLLAQVFAVPIAKPGSGQMGLQLAQKRFPVTHINTLGPEN
jgi:hypothetical protein